MWRTSKGDRVLGGNEAALFQIGLRSVLDWMKREKDYRIGISIFDNLSIPEKLAVLEEVASGLLESSVACKNLTAVNEAAIGAIYKQLKIDIGLSLVDGSRDIQRHVVQLLVDSGETEGAEADETILPLPSVESTDMDEWDECIEALSSRIHWDSDWAQPIIEPDDSPDVANRLRATANIDEDYYSAVPLDPNPSQLKRIKEHLVQLSTNKRF